jgi:hypothetical protein
MLTEFIQLRHTLVKELIANGISNFKVLDTCSVTSLKCTANTSSCIKALAEVTAQDGVHLTPEVYFNRCRYGLTCHAEAIEEATEALLLEGLPQHRRCGLTVP